MKLAWPHCDIKNKEEFNWTNYDMKYDMKKLKLGNVDVCTKAYIYLFSENQEVLKVYSVNLAPHKN